MQRQSVHIQKNDHANFANRIGKLDIEQADGGAPSVCQDCGAVCLDGVWRWMNGASFDEAQPTHCPACARISHKEPAALVTIQGRFSREHGDELINFVRNIEHHQKVTDPLQRIMSIDKRAEKLSIATTDTHLARTIGKALNQEYKGSLDFNYQKTEHILRVLWQR